MCNNNDWHLTSTKHNLMVSFLVKSDLNIRLTLILISSTTTFITPETVFTLSLKYEALNEGVYDVFFFQMILFIEMF